MDCLNSASDSKEVEVFRVLFLGKNGKITGLVKQMKGLSNEDKPKLGTVVNEAKSVVENAIETARIRLEEKEMNLLIEKQAIGNLFQLQFAPGPFKPRQGKRHPLSLTMDLATSIFEVSERFGKVLEALGYTLFAPRPRTLPNIRNTGNWLRGHHWIRLKSRDRE